jgi:hypothetical protein
MSVSPLWLPVFLIAGFVAGFFNTVAGGGSLITFPLLVLLGFPPQVANGTIRVAILLQNAASIPTFARLGHFHPRASLICAAVTVPASILGAFAAVRMDAGPFRSVSAVLLLAVLATLFLSPTSWTREETSRRIRWGPMLPLMVLVGFYGGFFQVGVGMHFLAAAVLVGGWDLVAANSIKVAVILLFIIASLFVFAAHGQVDWPVGLALGVGNMLGGWAGAHAAVRKGPGWIRWTMVVMGVAAAAKLVYDAATA